MYKDSTHYSLLRKRFTVSTTHREVTENTGNDFTKVAGVSSLAITLTSPVQLHFALEATFKRLDLKYLHALNGNQKST